MDIDRFEKLRPGMEKTIREKSSRKNGHTSLDPLLRQAAVTQTNNLTNDPHWDFYLSQLQARVNTYMQAAASEQHNAMQLGLLDHVRQAHVAAYHAHAAVVAELSWAMSLPNAMRGQRETGEQAGEAPGEQNSGQQDPSTEGSPGASEPEGS